MSALANAVVECVAEREREIELFPCNKKVKKRRVFVAAQRDTLEAPAAAATRNRGMTLEIFRNEQKKKGPKNVCSDSLSVSNDHWPGYITTRM